MSLGILHEGKKRSGEARRELEEKFSMVLELHSHSIGIIDTATQVSHSTRSASR
jgi:hypothetical protein